MKRVSSVSKHNIAEHLEHGIPGEWGEGGEQSVRALQDTELCIRTTSETTRVSELTRAFPNCPNQHRGTLLSI